jgi:hypothetical protein
MADSNLTNIGFVAESTFGTTPSTALQLLRRTGGQINPNQDTTRSGEIRSDLRPGRPVRNSQDAGGTVNVEWSYGTLDAIAEGMLMEDYASNVLVDGTTKKSYTFEEQYLGLATPQYMTYKGCRISALSMSLGVGSIVTGSFGVMAATPSIAQTSAGTGSATAITTTEPWNCVDMVTTLEEQSAALGKVTGIELNLTRNLRHSREIGSLNPFDIGVGALTIGGSITQYFEDDVLADAYFAFGDRSLAITLTDSASNALAVSVPKIKYVGALDITNPGPDSDCMVTANWEAYANVDDAALISFTRTPA